MSLDLLFAVVSAFFAGFIDAVVGGGGLIQLPALMILFPQYPVPILFGTNKLASICGTSAATVQYLKRITVSRETVLPATIAALIFSYLGAKVVSYLDSALLKPLILILLILVGTYTFKKKDFGSIKSEPKVKELRLRIFVSALFGGLLGFYDGFFGPGTGSFLILGFIWLFGQDFLQASASAKIVNLATNLAAIAYFGSHSGILYSVAIPMGVANLIGAVFGARLAILKGSKFVRSCFLVVVVALILKIGSSYFLG